MKHQATKLLAVVTLATAAPASANPNARADPWAHTADHAIVPAPPVGVAAALAGALALFGLATPGPAAPVEVSVAPVEVAPVAPVAPTAPVEVPVAVPRRLPNGTPACGNVQSRAARPCEPPAAAPPATIVAMPARGRR